MSRSEELEELRKAVGVMIHLNPPTCPVCGAPEWDQHELECPWVFIVHHHMSLTVGDAPPNPSSWGTRREPDIWSSLKGRVRRLEKNTVGHEQQIGKLEEVVGTLQRDVNTLDILCVRTMDRVEGLERP